MTRYKTFTRKWTPDPGDHRSRIKEIYISILEDIHPEIDFRDSINTYDSLKNLVWFAGNPYYVLYNYVTDFRSGEVTASVKVQTRMLEDIAKYHASKLESKL